MNSDKMSLTEAVKGSVVVIDFDGGQKFREKLINYGILPGVTMEVVSNIKSGATIVEVMGAKVVLGYGMAKRIYVKQQ